MAKDDPSLLIILRRQRESEWMFPRGAFLMLVSGPIYRLSYKGRMV